MSFHSKTKRQSKEHKEAAKGENILYQAKHQEISNSSLNLKKKTVMGLALISTGIIGTALTATTTHADTTTTSAPAQQAAPAAKTAAQINQEAMVVIHGDLGNGQDRIDNLQKAGFDPTAVQNKVNDYYNQLGYNGAYQASSQAVSQKQVAAPTQSQSSQQAAPAAQTTSSSDTVSYAAQQMAANTGVSASQWTAIMMRESGGNPNAVNASSGAYGLFQLLGHGEYPGMSVDAQIAMATQVYQQQGAGAWSETW